MSLYDLSNLISSIIGCDVIVFHQRRFLPLPDLIDTISELGDKWISGFDILCFTVHIFSPLDTSHILKVPSSKVPKIYLLSFEIFGIVFRLPINLPSDLSGGVCASPFKFHICNADHTNITTCLFCDFPIKFSSIWFDW